MIGDRARVINEDGAIIGTATYSGTATNIASGQHGVMLVPITITQSNYPAPSTADSTADDLGTISDPLGNLRLYVSQKPRMVGQKMQMQDGELILQTSDR